MRISLTDLVDVVSKAGSPKATKVRQLKAREDVAYQPAHDLYKQLRDRLVANHKNNGSKQDLHLILGQIHEQRRLQCYPAMIDAYQKWWGRKCCVWFNPPSAIYSHAGVQVSVNPELGLLVNEVPTVIKLYFKAEPLSRFNVSLITGLMGASLSESVSKECQMAVLDVRRSKLHCVPPGDFRTYLPMVNAELAYISDIWPSLGEAA